jgi:HTH-type transcriptional regulator / antitoxin HigA
LADRLGLKEQQIQRYEATDYASASLARVIEISEALGLELKGGLEVEVG